MGKSLRFFSHSGELFGLVGRAVFSKFFFVLCKFRFIKQMLKKLKCPFKLEREHSSNTSLFFSQYLQRQQNIYFLNIILSSKYQDVLSANTEVLLYPP